MTDNTVDISSYAPDVSSFDPKTYAVNRLLGNVPDGYTPPTDDEINNSFDPQPTNALQKKTDSAVGEYIDQSARTNLMQAAKQNPDQVASILQLSAITGLPFSTLQNNPIYAQQAKTMSGLGADGLPALCGAFLCDPMNAAISHDDIPNLKAVERTWGQVVTDSLASLAKTGNNIASAAVTLSNAPFDSLIDWGLQKAGYHPVMAASTQAAQQFFQSNVDTLTSDQSAKTQQQINTQNKNLQQGHFWDALTDSPLADVDQIGQVLPYFIPGIGATRYATTGLEGTEALAAATRANIGTNAAITAGTAGTQASIAVQNMTPKQLQATPAYQSLIAQGATPDEAKSAMADHAQAVGTALGGMFGGLASGIGAGVNARFTLSLLGNKIESAATNSALLHAGGMLGKEVLDNAAQSAGGALATNEGVASVNPQQNQLEGVGGAAATGAVMGFGMGMFPAVSHVIGAHVAKTTDAIQAVQQGENLQQAIQVAADSKVNARDPQAFQQFAQTVADNANTPNMFISADALKQSGLMDQVAKVSPSVADQLPTALATGGTIQIPSGEFASKIAPIDGATALADHVTTDPTKPTAAEAKAFLQDPTSELDNEVNQALTQRAGDIAFNDSASRVQDTIRSQLDNTQRYTPDQSDTMATLAASRYKSFAAEHGLTPEQAFEKFPLNVTAQHLLDDNVYGQRSTWQPDFPDATVLHPLGDITSHPDFSAAKAGDSKAALRLVDDTITPDDIQKLKDAYQGKADYVVPVHAVESTGKNKVPLAYAHKISSELGIPVRDNIVQSAHVGRSESDGVARLAKAVPFNGTVEAGKKYLLVDDALTQGGTLASLKGYIESHGGEVVGASALMGKQYSAKLAPSERTLSALRSVSTPEFEQWWKDEYGHGFDQLTESEARYLTNAIKKSNVDSVRARLLAAGSQGSKRTDASTLRSEESANHSNSLEPDSYHQGEDAARGLFDPRTSTIALLKNADLSTFIHELGHFFFETHIAIAGELHGGKLKSQSVAVRATHIGPAHPDYHKDIELPSRKALEEGNYENVTLKDGSEIRLVRLHDSNDEGEIRAYTKQGDFVGQLGYARYEENGIRQNPNIYVEEDYRRKGVATALYDLAEKTGAKIPHMSQKGQVRTDAGSAFRVARDQKITENIFNSSKNLSDAEKQHTADTSALLRYAGIKGDIGEQLAQWHSMPRDEKVAAHEKIAESFEHYIAEGKAPSFDLQHVFQSMRSWMIGVYKSIKQFLDSHPEAGGLTDEVRGVFDRMLASNQQIKEAEHGRSMMPLFDSPESGNMTPQEYSQYHAQSIAASLDAQQDQSARAVRDMRLLNNKKAARVKELTKQSDTLRNEAEIDVRREVMQQPVYRAWQFLTGRITPDDQLHPYKAPKSDPNHVDWEIDPLFTAIAKLGGISHDAAVKEWGLDPAFKSPRLAGNKPVVRKEGGLSIGAMEEKLGELGYLALDEHDKPYPHDLMERFDQEVAGHKQYSMYVDHSKMQGEERTGDRYNIPAINHARLNLDDVKRLGLPDDIVQKLVDRKMTTEKGGIDPDLAVEMHPQLEGFNSGEEMVRALAEATPPDQEIEGLTDSKMLEDHGELATPEAISRLADMSVHNDMRSKVLTGEVNQLNKMIGKRKINLDAIKEVVSNIISRKKVSDLLPSIYTRAESRAAKASEIAFKKGDLETSATERRNTLFNNLAAKATYAAQDEVGKIIKYFNRFKGKKYLSKMNIDEQEQILNLLSDFDLRKNPPDQPSRSETNLKDWYESQIDAGFAPAVDLLLLIPQAKRSYRDMTMEELRGLKSTIESIETVGRNKNVLTIDGKRVELDSFIKNEMIPKLKERGDKFTASEIIDTPEERHTNPVMIGLSHLNSWLRSAQAQLKPQEFKANMFDNHEVLGPFSRAIFEPIFASNYRKNDMLKGLSNDFAKQGEKLGKEWQDHILDNVPNDTLVDPDKSRIEGKTVFMKFTRSRMLGLALHVGNESNLDKVARGWGWDKADVWKFLHDNMNEKDWQAVDTAGQLFEKHFPEMQAMNKRLGNITPDKIEPRPFNTKFGRMDGWYAPIRYDSAPERSKLGERKAIVGEMKPSDALFGSNYFRADTTTNGSLNARSAGYTDRVDLDFHNIADVLNESIHDLAYRESLIDVHKILKNPALRQQFRLTYGNEAYNAMLHWVGNIANSAAQDRSVSSLSRFLAYSRTGIVINAIGFRASTVLKHGGSAGIKSFGYFPGTSKIFFAKRLAAIGTNYKTEISGAIEKFPEIRSRLMQQDRDFKQLQASMLEPESALSKAHRFGHATVAWADMMTAVPTAWAAYDRAVTTGIPVKEGGTGMPMSESDAVMYASKIVREAHGSNIESARSLVMNTNNEAVKMFTTLYGFMNNTYGQAADIMDKIRTAGLSNPTILGRTFAALLVPAIWAHYLNEGDSSADKDGFVHWISKAITSEAAGTVPFVRDAYSMIEGYRSAGQVGVESWINTVLKPEIDVYKAAEGKPVKTPIRDIADALGVGLHLPLGQIGTTAQYLSDVHSGKQPEPKTVGDALQGVVKGHVTISNR